MFLENIKQEISYVTCSINIEELKLQGCKMYSVGYSLELERIESEEHF